MNCQIKKSQLDDYIDNYLSNEERQFVESHLQANPVCREALAEAQSLRAQLRTLPAPSLKAETADLFFQRLQQTESIIVAKPAWKRSLAWGGALAASIVLAVAIGLINPIINSDNTIQVLNLNETRSVALALNSDRELKGVTLTLNLPDNVELAGYPGQKTISWQTDLQAGTNLLSLPLTGVAMREGNLVARIEHGQRSKELSVPLRVQQMEGYNRGTLQSVQTRLVL